MNSHQELKLVCEEYAVELPNKLSAIKSQWDQLNKTNEAGLLQELIRKVHSLNGSAATFGYFELSRVAWQLEQALRQHQAQLQNSTFTAKDFEQLYQALEQASQHPPDYDFSDEEPQPLNTMNFVQNDTPWVLLISVNK